MISLPIWIRHLGVLTYEDSACTDENDSGDGDQLPEKRNPTHHLESRNYILNVRDISRNNDNTGIKR